VNPESPWLRGAVVVSIVFVLYEAVLRGLRIDAIRPDLMLGLGIVAALVGGAESGAVVAFVGCLLGDLFVNTPFGLSALVACVVAYIAGTISAALGPNQRWSIPVLVGLGSATGEVMWASLATVLGLPGLLRPHLLVITLVVAAVNVAAALPFTVLARWVFAGEIDVPSGVAPRGFAS
jgi:rod shape-determining protein MreD